MTGVVCAMTKELVKFLDCFDNVEQSTINGFSVWTLKTKDKNVVIVQSGIGEIYAAAATQLLITLGANTIFNFGVCGSLSSDLKTCDCAVVEKVVHYDFDLSPIDDVKVAQYPGYKDEFIPCDNNLIKTAMGKVPSLKKSTLASADKFVVDEQIKNRLNSDYGASICDMEGAGVVLTCLNAGVPCMIIKAVSDGKGGAEEYFKVVHQASVVCATALKEILGL